MKVEDGVLVRPRRRAAKLSVKERQAQLLSSALDVFARKGIASSGHADVAERAGVAVPTVFRYFPTRAALVEGVVTEVERVILERAHKAATSCGSVPEQFLAILRDFATSLETDPNYATIWVDWGTSFYEDVWPMYDRFVKGTIRLHRELVDAGLRRGEPLHNVDPQLSAYQFIAGSTVMLQMYKQNQNSASIMRFAEVVVHGALNQT